MASSHNHPHDHKSLDLPDRAFAVGVIANAVFVAVEIAFGLWAGSLALLSDAGHNFSDVLGLLLSWWAVHLARQPSTSRFTYGMRRATIMAALANGVLLIGAVVGILWEAVHRLLHPVPVTGLVVVAVAAAGLLVNGLTALLFTRGREHDLNRRSAFLHMAADAGVSLGVIAAGFAMRFTGWVWLDPAIGIAIAVVIAASTWGLLRQSVDLSLDAVPEHIDPVAVGRYLATLPGVTGVHDLHIWAMSTSEVALTAHLVMTGAPGDNAFLRTLEHDLAEKFEIGHATIQYESDDPTTPCARADRNLAQRPTARTSSSFGD